MLVCNRFAGLTAIVEALQQDTARFPDLFAGNCRCTAFFPGTAGHGDGIGWRR